MQLLTFIFAMGFFDRLKEGLSKTRKNFVERVESVLLNRTIDESLLDEIEEISSAQMSALALRTTSSSCSDRKSVRGQSKTPTTS